MIYDPNHDTLEIARVKTHYIGILKNHFSISSISVSKVNQWYRLRYNEVPLHPRSLGSITSQSKVVETGFDLSSSKPMIRNSNITMLPSSLLLLTLNLLTSAASQTYRTWLLVMTSQRSSDFISTYTNFCSESLAPNWTISAPHFAYSPGNETACSKDGCLGAFQDLLTTCKALPIVLFLQKQTQLTMFQTTKTASPSQGTQTAR